MDRRQSIRLTPEEARRFLEESRTAVLASNGPDGRPHLVAMWYVVKDGDIMMTTYGRSQKAVNIRRDGRATMMVEAGLAYNQLRGVMIRGRAEIIEDLATTTEVLTAVSRKMSGAAALTPEGAAAIASQAKKRVVVRFHPEKWASWDHSKL
ncbi:MAG TPA: PPOX class F420-dependent oxidoreductase [Candidatus Binataceae bacterium]|nr:PPOX class F420-dependent oxidoreductase [Candidatus Binataceae bacterium]